MVSTVLWVAQENLQSGREELTKDMSEARTKVEVATVHRKELALSTHHQLMNTWATDVSEERHLSLFGV